MGGSKLIKEVQDGMEGGRSGVEKEGGGEEGKRGKGEGKDNQNYFYTPLYCEPLVC